MFTDRWVMREFVASVRTKENLKARRAGTASEPSTPHPPGPTFPYYCATETPRDVSYGFCTW